MSQTEIGNEKMDSIYSELVAEKEEVRRQTAELHQRLESIESSLNRHEEERQKQVYTNYKINPSRMEKIQGIIHDVKRYDTWEQFVDESLKNTITMWREPQNMTAMAGELWNDLTQAMKNEIKDKAPEYYYAMDQQFGIHNKVATMKKEIKVVKAALSKHKFPVPKNTVLGYYDEKYGTEYPYIHETYNRFFPLKILVTALASMIHKNLNIPGKTSWIDYEDFSAEAFELAQEFSSKLKAIKDKRGKDPHRNKRISTGLPIQYSSAKKTEASKERFFNCFVGPKLKSFLWINHSVKCNTCKKIFGTHDEEHDFSGKLILNGALNEMGLVHIREQNGKLEITLSKNGFEFCAPQKKDGKLFDFYETFKKIIKEKKDPIPLTEIYNFFSKPPYGIKSGLLPLLTAIFFKINEGSLAFYNVDDSRRESLITEYDLRICEKFVHIPEDLKIMYVKIEGEKQKILDDFKGYVEKRFLNNKAIKNPTPLQVLKPIVLKTYNLPAFAKKTRQFKDKRVLMLRDELLSTQNPHELLYKKIPEICGTEDPNQLNKEFDKIWIQLDQVFEDMIDQFKQAILKVFRTDPNISDMDFSTIKEWAKKIGPKDPFSAKINELKENDWIQQVISFAASKPCNEWNDQDFNQATLKIEEMVRHFIMSYRLYTLREKHSDTKIIDVAIFDGKKPERSSKFYKFKTDNSSVEKVTEDVMKLLEDKKLSESEKGEVVLKVLKKIMSFKAQPKGKIIA